MGDKRSRISRNYTMQDLLKGKDLDIICASLLLIGKLQVESVELFRNSPVIGVSLVGQFRSIENENEKANNLASFLDENGDMTLDDVIEALTKRMNNKRK